LNDSTIKSKGRPRTTTSASRKEPGGVKAAVDSPLTVHSVQKAFSVLTAFSQAQPFLTLKQVSEILEIDRSTAQRFTHTLVSMGYLEKDPHSKLLSVSVKVVDLAHIYLSTNPLISSAMPYMVHLSRETGQTINLMVLDGPEVVVVSRIIGNYLLSTGVIIGTRLPTFASAAGIAMLSTLGTDEITKLLDDSDIKLFTPKTIVDRDGILERIQLARDSGYAVSVEDYVLNDISIGSPILSRSGRLAGAMSLSVSIDKFDAAEAETRFGNLISAAAQSVHV
jgi:DNA-binding IclR family transcriptional regulator